MVLCKAVAMIGIAQDVGNKEQGRSTGGLLLVRGRSEKPTSYICLRLHVVGGR